MQIGFLLSRLIQSPRFQKVETYSPRCQGYSLLVRDEWDVDDERRAWLREAYTVGTQERLRR